jgi:hypothetical protein
MKPLSRIGFLAGTLAVGTMTLLEDSISTGGAASSGGSKPWMLGPLPISPCILRTMPLLRSSGSRLGRFLQRCRPYGARGKRTFTSSLSAAYPCAENGFGKIAIATILSGARPASSNSIAAAGRSRSISSRYSRRCNWRNFWAAAPMRCVGRSGRPFWPVTREAAASSARLCFLGASLQAGGDAVHQGCRCGVDVR